MSGNLTERRANAAEFRRLWQSWVRVTGYFARHRSGRPVTPKQYRQLHMRLIEACQDAQELQDVRSQKFYRHLEELVRPWVSLDALAHANKPDMMDLFQQCRAANRNMGRSRVLPRWLVLSAAVFLGAAALVLASFMVLEGWAGDVDLSLASLQDEGRSIGYKLYYTVVRLEPLQKFGIVTAVVVLLGFVMLRSTRSY